jgi:delta-aminolevulinic acid dehydratase/porphobilinogen synthase
VVYDDAEKVKSGNVTVPSMPESLGYSQEELVDLMGLVDRLVIGKVFDFPAEIRSNKRFPGLKLEKVRDLVRKAWEGV